MGVRVAVVQLTTTTDQDQSLAEAQALVKTAAASGAKLVALPENVSFMGSETEKAQRAESLDGPTFSRMAEWAQDFGIHLLAGSIPEKSADPRRPFNTSVLFSPTGEPISVYRKIHLFDVALGPGATHTESDSVSPGDRLALGPTPAGVLGLSICYDLRFAGLYRALVRAGAQVLAVPSAFTIPTGRDHWEVLLRARAIENQCYVLAPAQVGRNTERRRTYGRSMIIDPWGTILAQCPDRPSVASAEIDLETVDSFRCRLPCLEHERPNLYRIG